MLLGKMVCYMTGCTSFSALPLRFASDAACANVRYLGMEFCIGAEADFD